MAKTTHCSICGKEITTGFFSGEDYTLTVGNENITCCHDCYEQYQPEAKRIRKRFEVKLNNYKKATKQKLTEAKVLQMFLTYLAEEKEQISRCGSIDKSISGVYFKWDEKEYFAIREYDLGTEYSAKQMVKNSKKAEDVGDVWFSKDDITKLEYRTTLVGDSLGLFSTAFSFEIRLNDDKVLTYKPCISKMFFIGTGLFPHNQRKKAREQCRIYLEALKRAIGSDLPVVEVKKFA